MNLLRTAITILLVLPVVPASAAAQRTDSTTAPPHPAVAAARLSTAVAVDGCLDEEAWQKAPLDTGYQHSIASIMATMSYESSAPIKAR